MTVVEYGDEIVVVDTGLMFPTSEMLGIDLVLPDFSYLRSRARDIQAIVLTHAPEDHVGALPFVLREIFNSDATRMPPIYGGALTIGLVRSKLEEHKIRDAPLEVLEPAVPTALGSFELEFVHMAHSIPDSCAVVLRTELGPILITGDYKFDQTPVDGNPADVSRLAALGAEGLLCLCGDSTNADRPGIAPSESSVGPALLDLFARCKGRIIVTSFASNVHRVQQAIDAAAQLDRKVALVGRSMRKNFNIARNLGIAAAPDGMLISPKEIESFPDHKVVAISTGSQGEPLSALRRMAHADHPDVELHSGDTVIFSATPIPGNERSVNETIDRIFEIGAEVVTAADAPIHASGHGWQEELKLMLNLTHPRYVMPFHGDFKRLRLHARLAESVGIAPDRIFRSRHGGAPHIHDVRGRPRAAGAGGSRARGGGAAPRARGAEWDDLRRRRRHRQPGRRRSAGPSCPVGRRRLHRGCNHLVERRISGRAAGDHLSRRPIRRGVGWAGRRAAGRGRAFAGRRRQAPGARDEPAAGGPPRPRARLRL